MKKLTTAKALAGSAILGFMRAKESLLKANELIAEEQNRQLQTIEIAQSVIDEAKEEFDANQRIINKLNDFTK
jgi:hypothetical protein